MLPEFCQLTQSCKSIEYATWKVFIVTCQALMKKHFAEMFIDASAESSV